MILQVQDEKEAVEVSRQLVKICNDIRMAFVEDDIKAMSYEAFLCQLCDSIQVGAL